MLKSNYDNRLAGVGVGVTAGVVNGNIIICERFQIEAAEYVQKKLIRLGTPFQAPRVNAPPHLFCVDRKSAHSKPRYGDAKPMSS